MELKSPVFENGKTIPKKYGYHNGNTNPPLIIENIPVNTKSLVLIMDDPDAIKAVGKIWVHWILWNISPHTKIIDENSIPENTLEGMNDFGEIGYGGPAPPDKEHEYIFSLYALNKTLNIKSGSSKKDVESEISDFIIEKCVLLGKYFPQ